MKPQNHTLRLIVSCAIVFSLAVTVVFIQEFKENEKDTFGQKPNQALYLSNQHWLGK
jgi:hypothetical protein